MQHFASGDIDIAYDVAGEGPPVLLVHGFASNAQINWVSTGWVKTLTEAGRQVIVIDNRGHGQSGKPYDTAAYPVTKMAQDSINLLDHLGIGKADIMGYSMGARISAFLAIHHASRVNSAVLAGLAENIFRGVGRADELAIAFEAEDPATITHPMAQAFRRFADQTKSDRKALAACIRADRPAISVAELGTITAPVLVVCGDQDDIAGRIEPLVEAIPGAKGVYLKDRDHMKAVGDLTYKRETVDFLDENGLVVG